MQDSLNYLISEQTS